MDLEAKVKIALERHGLHPVAEPMGDGHHTDAPFTKEDNELGELAYYLGGLFIDKKHHADSPLKDTYWFNEMTSVDVWRRVARALRIHGLAIVDASRALGQGDRENG